MTIAFMQGNHACAQAALIAGCRFFAGYPITPSSEIMEQLARDLPARGDVFIQMEDEIASIAAVLGASAGGLKAMTATSGPGFSLMQENIGYAAMAEIPCVIVDVQRAGPSTGLPTHAAQGDMMQARWGTHGDHPIIALCPWSVQEAFDLTLRAFELGERFRTPVILLMDEIVGHMRERVKVGSATDMPIIDRAAPSVPPEWYYPYEDGEADVPPLAPFGHGFRYHITGLYHDRAGFPTERPDEIAALAERLFAKLDNHLDEIADVEQKQLPAETLIVSYGIAARAAEHAAQLAWEQGRSVGTLRLRTVWPFPDELVAQAAAQATQVIVPEMNLGQIALEVERVVGRDKVQRINQIGGQPLLPDRILAALKGFRP